MNEQHNRNADFVLPPGSYAYMLNKTKGKVSILTGPFKTPLSGTEDSLVLWDGSTYVEVKNPDDAKQLNIVATEGQYIVLSNPAGDDIKNPHPQVGGNHDAIDLVVGKTMVIKGPTTFPLWPGQDAEVIDGHRLRNNQSILVRIVQPEDAKANWDDTVVKFVPGSETEETPQVATTTGNLDFIIGQKMVIKGTDVSYYVPPTGVAVIPNSKGELVRDAVTLEQLEYCVLVSESGKKRYVTGPAVVFPEPTEMFLKDGTGKDPRVFNAIELNPLSGVYIKVTADYEDEKTKETIREGTELFITGKDTPFYIPRPEHTIIKYGKQIKHHAIAIPDGEGRYVLNRETGKVKTVKGPVMFMPDPRTEVVVRRHLDESTVMLYYPSNVKAIEVNQEIGKTLMKSIQHSVDLTSAMASMNFISEIDPTSFDDSPFSADMISRGSTFTKPRTVVLDTKYDGVVSVNVWPGYAVMVVDKSGNRRVEVGPKPIMLEYDEHLMVQSISTGRPKPERPNTKSVYLRIDNRMIGDIFRVHTKDMIGFDLELTLRVNFTGNTQEEMAKWFDCGNYVRLVCDTCRTALRNTIKDLTIQEFMDDRHNVVDKALIGVEFPHLDRYNIQIQGVDIASMDLPEQVGSLLRGASYKVLESTIALQVEESNSTNYTKSEEIKRQSALAKSETNKIMAAVEKQSHIDAKDTAIAKFDKDQVIANATTLLHAEMYKDKIAQATAEKSVLEQKAIVDDMIMASETKHRIDLIAAVSEDFIAALQTFGDKMAVNQYMKSIAPVAASLGVTSADIFKQVFAGTPFESIMSNMANRPLAKITPGSMADASDE